MDNAPLSSSIGQLTNLEQLDLNTNNFSGSLPKEIGNLTKLTWLNLSQLWPCPGEAMEEREVASA